MKQRKLVVSLVIFALITVGAVFLFGRNQNNESSYESYSAKLQTITRSVNISGRVQAKKSISLGFEQTGAIKQINIAVGDQVRKNEELARLNISGIEAQLREARANVDLQEARLAELERGSRPEEILIKERQLEIAKELLSQAYDNVLLESRESYTTADDIIRNTVDTLFNNPRSANPQLKFSLTSDVAVENSLEFKRLQAESMLEGWNSLTSGNITKPNQVSAIASESMANLKKARLLLDDAALAVNTVTPTQVLTQTTIDTWKTLISTARNTVNSKIQTLQTYIQAINTQMATVLQRENELALAVNGATVEELNQFKAQVNQAKAAVSALQSSLGERILKSPREATVTEIYKEVGEVATANEPVIELITNDDYEIIAEIPEVDIAEIMVGQITQLSFDALPGIDFMGQVIAIDPAETVKEGVIIYEVTIIPDNPDNRIRPGMTANIEIITATKIDALSIPRRFVNSSNPEKETVTIKTDDEFTTTQVMTGIIGSDSFVEIIDGLQEGSIVWFIPNQE